MRYRKYENVVGFGPVSPPWLRKAADQSVALAGAAEISLSHRQVKAAAVRDRLTGIFVAWSPSLSLPPAAQTSRQCPEYCWW
ncbi:hypothetical protein E2C01_098558 [Portunus trituberculatus]|uniref:Uncharacterized protein n=1 Tax=Portunus trituberculatus TaxID=210409 RepID=A0A5B7KD80_PORTR|nr:hypothetical protein [Portunus trituberculatus]